MRTENAFVGARGIDSIILLNDVQCKDLRASGVDFAMQYLGSVTADGVHRILDAGLAFMPVTYANKTNGASAVIHVKGLGLPAGCTVWLDIEGVTDDAVTIKKKINDWCVEIIAAGYMPGMYVGAGCPLTSIELYSLKTVRYWHSVSRVTDRNGALAEPACGWAMHQLHPPNLKWADTGIIVDVDCIQQDYRGRVPAWVVA